MKPDRDDLNAILSIGDEATRCEKGETLQAALAKTRYRELRHCFGIADLIPMIRENTSFVQVWIHYSEDKRTSHGFWLDPTSFKVGSMEPGTHAVDHQSIEEAVANYVVQELDFWSSRD